VPPYHANISSSKSSGNARESVLFRLSEPPSPPQTVPLSNAKKKSSVSRNSSVSSFCTLTSRASSVDHFLQVCYFACSNICWAAPTGSGEKYIRGRNPPTGSREKTTHRSHQTREKGFARQIPPPPQRLFRPECLRQPVAIGMVEVVLCHLRVVSGILSQVMGLCCQLKSSASNMVALL